MAFLGQPCILAQTCSIMRVLSSVKRYMQSHFVAFWIKWVSLLNFGSVWPGRWCLSSPPSSSHASRAADRGCSSLVSAPVYHHLCFTSRNLFPCNSPLPLLQHNFVFLYITPSIVNISSRRKRQCTYEAPFRRRQLIFLHRWRTRPRGRRGRRRIPRGGVDSVYGEKGGAAVAADSSSWWPSESDSPNSELWSDREIIREAKLRLAKLFCLPSSSLESESLELKFF